MTDRVRGAEQWQRQWRWDLEVAPRWLLVGHTGTPQDPGEDAVALCADIDGLFVDLPPRPRERFTLLGCVPEGVLIAALDRSTHGAADSKRARLGDLWVSAKPGDPAERRGWIGERLLDVTVLDHRPSRAWPGCVDIELDGLADTYDRTDAIARPDDVTGFALTDPEDAPCGSCADVTGLFREQTEPPVPHTVLIGCRPEPPLLDAIAALPRSTEAALRRRRVSAQVGAVAANGSVTLLVDCVVSGTIVACEPSAHGAGLLDVTIAGDAREPRPAGTRGILDVWFTGRPTQRNLWSEYDRTLRHEWAGVALAHHRFDAPDRPAGTMFDLDGRFVTDVEGFYCAIGEAVNGPGGYFGWNLDAFADCLRGKWGVRTPFRLVWHDSAVAREHLLDGYDRHRHGPAVTLDYLLGMFTEHGVEVELR
ncbi:barstar family protein [Actinomadura viridis]|uniref:barstar family protein n=1 Tax=Actinomadura viridis TaxID=58110 RepID=UPI0036A90891